MATRTMPFCLEMLTFGPPRELRRTRVIPRREEGDWPLAQCLFAWKCLHLATQRALAHFEIPDAGRVTSHSHSAF